MPDLRARLTALVATWRKREQPQCWCADELETVLREMPEVHVVATERELIAAQFGEREPSEAPSQTETWLREEWWLNHGCAVSSLYGDDGEMQCGACRVDFKRQPLGELHAVVERKRMERLARAAAPEETPDA